MVQSYTSSCVSWVLTGAAMFCPLTLMIRYFNWVHDGSKWDCTTGIQSNRQRLEEKQISRGPFLIFVQHQPPISLDFFQPHSQECSYKHMHACTSTCPQKKRKWPLHPQRQVLRLNPPVITFEPWSCELSRGRQREGEKQGEEEGRGWQSRKTPFLKSSLLSETDAVIVQEHAK